VAAKGGRGLKLAAFDPIQDSKPRHIEVFGGLGGCQIIVLSKGVRHDANLNNSRKNFNADRRGIWKVEIVEIVFAGLKNLKEKYPTEK